MLVVRDDDSFCLEFGSSFHGNALIWSLDLQFLGRIDLGVDLGLDVGFVIDCVAQVAHLISMLKMVWHRHLSWNGLLTVGALYQALLVLIDVIECLGDRRVHPLISHLLQSTLLGPRRILKGVLLCPKLLLR